SVLIRALQDALAREGQRAASTGGSATIAAFRGAALPRRADWDWRQSPARPIEPGGGAIPARGHAAAGFAQAAQAAFDVGAPAADVARLVARAEELARYGLAIEPFGPGAVAVRETPALLGEIDAAALLRDLAEHMAEWDETLPLERRLMHVAATMACYGAVRAG